MMVFGTQTSLPKKRPANIINPEGCFIKDCLFNYRSQGDLKAGKEDKSERKRKITLVTTTESQHEKNICIQSKGKRKSVTHILQPQLPRGSSLERLKVSNSPNSQPMRRSCILGSHSLKPKVTIKITTKPQLQKNVFTTEHSKPNVLGYSSVSTHQKNRPSLNAIKTSKININPLIIARPSSVMEVSYEPTIDIKERYMRQMENVPFQSTKNLTNSVSTFFKSAVGPVVSNLEIQSSNLIQNTAEKDAQLDVSIYEQSPRLHRSIVSYSQAPSFSENNVSEVIFKIPVAGAKIDLEPQDLRRGSSFMKTKFKRGNSRTMTFAQEGTSDKSGDTSDDDRLSHIISTWRKFNSFEEYFNRGGFIGSGRISTVYRVEDKKSKLIVASKEVFKRIVYQDFSESEMNKDIKKHFKLPLHKNILTLYGTFQDTGRYYFITQLCENNLRHTMKQSLSQETSINYLKNILTGLQVLHRHNIVHKNVKPENILVSLDVCKVSDFGWAGRLLETNNHYPNFQYTSPEMANNLNSINQKTDCWSVGIIAYQMVFGELPLDSNTDIIEKNQSKIRTLSRKYRCLLQGLLQIDPIDRLTASKALEILEQEPISRISLEQIQQLLDGK